MNLVKIIGQLWSRKWTIIIVAFIFGVLGFVLALDIPKKYKTVVVLAPESSETDLASTASSITSMLGLNMGANGMDAIYPELYPDIINTIPFSVDMLNIQVCTMDSLYQGDLYHYLANYEKSPCFVCHCLPYYLLMQEQKQSGFITIGYGNIRTGNIGPRIIGPGIISTSRTTYRCGLNNPGILQGVLY